MEQSTKPKVYENVAFDNADPDVEGAFEEEDEDEVPENTVSFWSLYRYVATS
jgi:hypothetical protein